MHIRMRNAESLSQAQISEFLKASEGIRFAGQGRAEVYGWVQQMLVNQEYARQERKPRGAIRAYLSKVTGLSLAQISEFLKASEGIRFAGQGRAEVYGWVQQTLVNQEYARQERKPRGAIRAY